MPNPIPEPTELDSPNPVDHLRAGHTVVAHWTTDTTGYLSLFTDDTPDDPAPLIDVYDSVSGDAGPTEAINCRDCDRDLDTTDPEGNPYL